MSETPTISNPTVLAAHCPQTLLLDESKVRETIRWWAFHLSLTHWVIDFRFLRGFDMGNALGRFTFTLSKHRGTISLLDPNDLCGTADPYDMEQVIFHELLHAHFAAWHEWCDEDAVSKMGDVDRSVCEEQPIERLSWVLVTMRRKVNNSGLSCHPDQGVQP